ncbi:unnamed protein product [Schistosoma spindalis]|nr:unnamed protein product [Schistosoma spindale]
MIETEYGHCNICFDAVPYGNMLFLSACGCSFCRQCLKTYVITVLRDRVDVNCACPSYPCSQSGQLTDSEIRELLPSDVYERFSVKKLQREIEQNVNLTFCPAVNCGAVCQVPSVLKVPIPNGINPSTRSNKHALERFTRWYRRYLCSSQGDTTHVSSSTKSTSFRTDDASKILNNAYYKPINNLRDEDKEDCVTTPTSESAGEKDLLHISEKTTLMCQVSPGRPAVRVVCKQCSHEFCARCHLNWHIGVGPYVCEEYPRNVVKGNKNLNTQFTSQHNLLGISEKSVNASDHINPHSDPDPIIFEKHQSQFVTQNPEIIKSLPSLRKPPEKNKINKISLRRSKKKRRNYLQSHTGIHLSNQDISDTIDVSVLAVGFPPYSPDDWLKRCPACLVPIERIEGCAQMMCRSCKHTFCWYCLTSLDDDFLLQHYDDGACKGKLGHSRASVIGHRVYVVSVFTGLTILLLVAAPFIMVAVPCIICAKCHRLYRQHRLRKRHSQGLYMVNGRVLNTPVSSNVQNDRTDTPQPTSSTPHHSIFIPSCRSSIVSVDHRLTVEQKADIHWSPWQNESKCTSTRKVMHRSRSVPAYCCTVPLNSLIMNSHTP